MKIHYKYIRAMGVTGVVVHAVARWLPEMTWLSVMIIYFILGSILNEMNKLKEKE